MKYKTQKIFPKKCSEKNKKPARTDYLPSVHALLLQKTHYKTKPWHRSRCCMQHIFQISDSQFIIQLFADYKYLRGGRWLVLLPVEGEGEWIHSTGAESKEGFLCHRPLAVIALLSPEHTSAWCCQQLQPAQIGTEVISCDFSNPLSLLQ